ncbi:hypothetical protein MTS1_01286 [Microbacterium sp. TS-1]|nr:hypothetical protein MTS1_01286 [Microbacterium sp. TS-1]
MGGPAPRRLLAEQPDAVGDFVEISRIVVRQRRDHGPAQSSLASEDLLLVSVSVAISMHARGGTCAGLRPRRVEVGTRAVDEAATDVRRDPRSPALRRGHGKRFGGRPEARRGAAARGGEGTGEPNDVPLHGAPLHKVIRNDHKETKRILQ